MTIACSSKETVAQRALVSFGFIFLACILFYGLYVTVRTNQKVISNVSQAANATSAAIEILLRNDVASADMLRVNVADIDRLRTVAFCSISQIAADRNDPVSIASLQYINTCIAFVGAEAAYYESMLRLQCALQSSISKYSNLAKSNNASSKVGLALQEIYIIHEAKELVADRDKKFIQLRIAATDLDAASRSLSLFGALETVLNASVMNALVVYLEKTSSNAK